MKGHLSAPNAWWCTSSLVTRGSHPTPAVIRRHSWWAIGGLRASATCRGKMWHLWTKLGTVALKPSPWGKAGHQHSATNITSSRKLLWLIRKSNKFEYWQNFIMTAWWMNWLTGWKIAHGIHTAASFNTVSTTIFQRWRLEILFCCWICF